MWGVVTLKSSENCKSKLQPVASYNLRLGYATIALNVLPYRVLKRNKIPAIGTTCYKNRKT